VLEAARNCARPHGRLHRQRCEREDRPQRVPVCVTARCGADQRKRCGGEQHAEQTHRARADAIDQRADRHAEYRVDEGRDGQAHCGLRARPAELCLQWLQVRSEAVDVDHARRVAQRRSDRQREIAAPLHGCSAFRRTHESPHSASAARGGGRPVSTCANRKLLCCLARRRTASARSGSSPYSCSNS
jgi:hypothetical protein